ncbi:MAG TPA: MBL fold metallo-hydrolase, partial [Candidatus Anaerotruncus excrementipullorum]|nr:MBL fold metallo-hydrolase [Candidatus Anaerotruncus excrementipullorum]
VWEIAGRILELCAQPVGFEELLRQLFDSYQLAMNFEQYVLVGSTVRSYLSWLKDTGRLEAAFSGNRLLWRRA